jgi:hypothetical protein
MIRKYYNMVMDADQNSFSKLPRAQKFQLMTVLSYMWSIVFSLGVGSIMVFGTSVIFHMLLIVGTFITADLFYKSREGTIVTDPDE